MQQNLQKNGEPERRRQQNLQKNGEPERRIQQNLQRNGESERKIQQNLQKNGEPERRRQQNLQDNGESERRRQLRRKKEREHQRRIRRRRVRIMKMTIAGVILLFCIILIIIAVRALKNKGAKSAESDSTASQPTETASVNQLKTDTLASAGNLAAMYDYDKAIAAIEAYSGYESDTDMTAAIANYTSAKSSCTAADLSTVPHVFFHSLINDNRAFLVTDQVTPLLVQGNNSAMTTTGEFDAMLNDMYKAGYVLIGLDDIVIKTANTDGTETLAKNTALMLPAGKKPLLMSEDDLSYYHFMGENGIQGYADKLVLDSDGKVKCLFTDKSGTQQIGDYDMVPKIDTFISEHPDFCYQGARPTVALTGYDGVLGYRTNDYYKEGPDGEHLSSDQKAYLTNHPDYNYDNEVAEATKIADAMKAEGWTFASHTYGHWNASTHSAEELATDNERWNTTVRDVVGDTDKIIFAFGADIGPVNGYNESNDKFTYFLSQGYHIYCNVDGNIGWTEFGSNYVRTGRVPLDGVSMYNAMTESASSHTTYAHDYEVLGINDIASFFDPDRTLEYCTAES